MGFLNYIRDLFCGPRIGIEPESSAEFRQRIAELASANESLRQEAKAPTKPLEYTVATTKKKAAKKKAKAKSKPSRARSAKSGKFVSKKFAKKHKSTTVVES